MTFNVLRPFAGHQVGSLLSDLVGHNIDYLLSAGFIEPAHDATEDEKPARTVSKKRKD
jgi:hypothetical protein